MTLKRIVLIGVAVVVVLGVGLGVWARSVLTGDAVRTAVAEQMSQALGQPVTIGSLGASVFPRVTLDVGDVMIGAAGKPGSVAVKRLHIGTALGALLSRKIEHADLTLDGARIVLPLPALPASTSPATAPGESSAAPVELVSIDEVVLKGVEVVARGRTLTGDIEVEPRFGPTTNALIIRRIALGAGDAAFEITGEIKDLAKYDGDLTVRAGALNVDELTAFAADFMTALGPMESSDAPMDMRIAMMADRATMGGLALTKLDGKARVTATALVLSPVTFGVFGGTYSGAVTLGLAGTPSFTLDASLANVDAAAAMAYAGNAGLMTGTMRGALTLSGAGATAAEVGRSAKGKATLTIANGTIKNLGLVRGIVVATSMRSDTVQNLAGSSSDEPFTTMGFTFDIGGGRAVTDDLVFESANLRLAAAGTVQLDGSGVDIAGKAQLSESLTQAAGRSLVAATEEQGRVTLPVTITGPAAAFKVRVDSAAVAKRAVLNNATSAAKNSLKKGLGKIIK